MLRALLALALAFPLVAAGCGGTRPAEGPATAPVQPAPPPPPSLGGAFSLGLGESATVDGLQIGFATILEDSRCPVNTTCVWEGRATVNLTLGDGARTGGVNLEIPGGAGVTDEAQHRSVVALEHRFTLLALDPHPGTEEAEAGAPPRVTLLVERAGR